MLSFGSNPKDYNMLMFNQKYIFFIPEYNAMAKSRQTLTCDWENVTQNRAKINEIDQNLNAMFESIKNFKNVIKFVRLQNERHFKELGFIRAHLRKMSKKSSINPNGLSIKVNNHLPNSKTARFDTDEDWNQSKIPEGWKYVMSSGDNYDEFLSATR